MNANFNFDTQPSKRVRKVVILHGLLCHAAITLPLNTMLKAKGYQCLSLSYPSRKHSLAQNAEQLLPKIQAFAQEDSLYFIGHSLGGLLIRHLQIIWPEGFAQSRVVTLGTPHMGSKVADYFHLHKLRNKVLGESWHHALDGLAPDWETPAPLLSIAGTRALGVGKTLKIFTDDEPNDGTVAVVETQLPRASAYKEVPATHTALLFSPSTVAIIDDWLRHEEPEHGVDVHQRHAQQS